MEFIEIFKVILIGIVQGITEWLPISSTGHMILLDELIKLNVSDAFWEMFLVMIQLGSILAVVVLYFKRLNPFSLKKTASEKKETWIMWLKVLIAILPAGIIGVLFDEKINSLFYNYITVGVALIVYGVLFIVIENRNKNKMLKMDSIDKIDYKTALLIGCFQVLALIPGTSRSGSTIIGAMLLGVTRLVAAEFSFFMAIPVMFGASLLKLIKFGFDFTSNEIIVLLTGMAVAFIVSLFAIKFLISFVKKHSFKEFGYYRIGLGIIVIVYFLVKMIF